MHREKERERASEGGGESEKGAERERMDDKIHNIIRSGRSPDQWSQSWGVAGH